MKIAHAKPGTDLYDQLHRGRITQSDIGLVCAAPGSKLRDDLVRRLTAELTGREPEADRAFLEAGRLEKRRVFMDSLAWQHYRQRDIVCINDTDMTFGQYGTLACTPQGIAQRGDRIVDGLSVRLHRSLTSFKYSKMTGVGRRDARKAQYCMLICECPVWHVLHVWEAIDHGTRQDHLECVARDDAEIRAIYRKIIVFMEEVTDEIRGAA